MLEGEPISAETKEFLTDLATELESYVKKYGILKSVSADEAEQFAATNPDRIFTALPCHASLGFLGRAETELRPGFHPNESPFGFYISDTPFDPQNSYPYPYIEIGVHCSICRAEDDENDDNNEDECVSCGTEDGYFFYWLDWDQSGKVSIAR
jgi:hypothetical protein